MNPRLQHIVEGRRSKGENPHIMIGVEGSLNDDITKFLTADA